MLAVQRPSMASGHTPDGTSIGFGFHLTSSIDGNPNSLLHDAPGPPPGDPLLTDSDNNFLDSFFENWDSHQFDLGRNYDDTLQGAAPTHSEYWNLPPQFMGTRTSYGGIPDGQQFGQNFLRDMITPTSAAMPPPPPPPSQPHLPALPGLQDPTPSAEVIAAAQSLLHNPPIVRTNSQPHDTFRDTRPPPLGPPPTHLRHQPVADFSTPPPSDRRLLRGEEHTWTDMVFGTPPRQPQPSSAPRYPGTDLRWGSDVNFGSDQAYMPLSERETTEALEKERIKSMECLEVSRSAATTRPSSPLGNGELSPHQARYMKAQGRAFMGSPFVKVEEEDTEAPPRKRRKSRAKEEIEDDEDESSKRGGARRSSKFEATPEAASSGSRRRKTATAAVNGSASAAGKQPRENLSESQKRENHIKSEQKRRTVIKEGFDDLSKIVPGLKGSGFSKSTLLTMSADWLEELIRGNKALKEQLAGLQAR